MSSSDLLILAAAAAGAYYYFNVYLHAHPAAAAATANSAAKNTFYRSGKFAGGTHAAPSTSPSAPASSRNFSNNRKEGYYRATALSSLGIGF